ncbi:MAG: glycine--tRNA ligase subunit beta, partial [Lysobacterales bacterium]
MCAQRVRAAGVPAPDLAYVDTAVEKADEQAAEHGADEIRQRELEPELDHPLPFRRISRSCRNGTAPSPAEPRPTPLGGRRRRLVAHDEVTGIERSGFKHDTDLEELVTGPSVATAFGADGQPTPAAAGFARKYNVDISQLERVETTKGTHLGYRKHQRGKAAVDVLPDVLATALRSFSFPKA